MNTHKALNTANTLASLFIIIGINTFAHICTSMVGPCAKTKTFAIVIAVILAILGVAQIVVDKKNVNTILGVVAILGGITTILLPLVIAPVCSMPSMHCYVYTRPFLVIVGIVIALIALVDTLISLKKQ